MQMSPEALVGMTVTGLKLDPPPTEGEIDEVLDRLIAAFGVDPATREQVRRTLHARFQIRMELGATLVSSDDHDPWVNERRGGIDPFYWQRYREMLSRNGWPPLVLATLDRSTDELLDFLGNPVEPDRWKRRGLVMGDVQSGKTATYAALMCKAADAGYRMIILLTGTLENVRRQTQERLDEGFVGFDSRGYLVTKGIRQTLHIGVGLIDGRRNGIVFTSSENDFRKSAASALNISLSSVNEPVLIVAKKNKAVLERLETWLRLRNKEHDNRIGVPLLLIDDEADNASVNTRGADSPTSINKAIRNLLRLFRRSSYVGFTATPFANIFIDPESTTEMEGDDLFPNDFIHVLEAPTNYVGMHRLFGLLDPEAELAEDGGPLRSIADAENWIDAKLKTEADPEDIPNSLTDAIHTFLLGCAIRDLRAERGQAGGGGGIHRSMLVNVTQFTAVQNRIVNLIHVELNDIRTQVRSYGSLPPDEAAGASETIAKLQALFEREFGQVEQAWPDVLAALNDAIGPVKVQPVNASTGAKSLDYRVADSAPGVRVIAVGGNSLSRGLTLEGLSVSYFYRTSRAYDTLLQMGRWFGYRTGYEDLCRVWITPEAEGWYRHISEATAELKRDFMTMKKRRATPREFGIRIRTHPETLLITARNKMASGVNVEVATHQLNLAGQLIESTRLFKDRKRNVDNLELLQAFYERIVAAGSMLPPQRRGAALVWTEVPSALIADFVEQFAVHPLNFDFQGDSIAAYLRARQDDPVMGRWTVALPLTGTGTAEPVRALPDQEVSTRKRRVDLKQDGSLLVSGKSARVGQRADALLGLDTGVAIASDASEREIRKRFKHPLLITYLLRGFVRDPERPAETELSYLGGLVLPALGLHFPGEPAEAGPAQYVTYRLNRVAQQHLFDTEADDSVSDDLDKD